MANKASRTIQEQIELLENRGMMFRDKAFAMECLKRISYFRLKAYWWDMQSDPINHIFTNGSCFEDVIERYEFDNALRKILFTAIDTIEKYSHLPILRMGFFAGWEQEPIWATKRDQKTWLEKIIASMFGCLGRNA